MAGPKMNSFDSNDLENGPLSPPPAGRFEPPRSSSPRGSVNFSLRSPSNSISLSAEERWDPARNSRSPDRSSTSLSKFNESNSEPKYIRPTTGKPLPPVVPESPDSQASNTTPRANNLKGRSIDVMDYIKQHPQPADSYFGQSATSLLPPPTALPSMPQYDEKRSTTIQPTPETTFAHRVFEAGKPDLLYDLVQRRRFKERTCGVLDLSTLQRMSQHVLQQKLVEQTRALGEKGRWMEIGIRETLHAYCESIRDTELMEQHAARGMANDPFLITTGSGLQSRILEDAGLVSVPRLRAANANSRFSRSESDQDETPRLALLKRESPRKRGFRRTLMALVAALSLVAPMLIMILVPGQLTKILTATIFAVVFAIAFSVGSEMSPDKVALVVGVYAAVLVVFVSNNPPAY